MKCADAEIYFYAHNWWWQGDNIISIYWQQNFFLLVTTCQDIIGALKRKTQQINGYISYDCVI